MASGQPVKRGLRVLSKVVFAAADFPYRTRPGPRILIYHQVDAGMGRQMEVTEKNFAFQLDWLLEHGTVVTLDEALARADEPDSHRLFVITFDDGYHDVYVKARPLLEAADVPYLVYLTTGPIETGQGVDAEGRDQPLTWDQVAEMAAGGATIGAHTHTHPDLRHLTTMQAEEELETSDNLIEQRLGMAPEHFCYPYGYWSEAAHPVVAARYRTATLGAGPPVAGATDPHKIHRVPIQLADSPFFFTRKLTSGMTAEEAVRRRIVGYRGV